MIVTPYLKNGNICPSLPYQMAHTTTKKVCKLTVEQSVGAFFFFKFAQTFGLVIVDKIFKCLFEDDWLVIHTRGSADEYQAYIGNGW